MVRTGISDKFEKALTNLLQVINADIVNVEFDYTNEDVTVTYTPVSYTHLFQLQCY